MFRIFQIFCLVSILLILGACGTQPQVAIPQTIQSDQGLVVVRTVTNTSTFDPANIISFNKWEVIHLIDSAEKKYSLTLEKSGGRNNSQLFAGVLPEGRYTLHSMVSLPFAKRVTAMLIDNKIEFEVKNQHITNLGTLIYQPTGNNGFTILPLFNDLTILESLRVSFPQIINTTANNPILSVDKSNIGEIVQTNSNQTYINSFSLFGNLITGVISNITDAAGASDAEQAWTKEKNIDRRMSMAKDRTFVFNDVQELETGEIIAASNLGQVLIRHPNKGWQRLDTGYQIEYTAIEVLNGEQILVGGEESTLMYSANAGKIWKRIKAPVNNALLLDISHHNDEFFILSRENDDLIVSSTKTLELGNWKELLRINNIAQTTKFREWKESASAVISKGKYIVLSPLGNTHIFDPVSRTWTKYKLPKQGFFRLRKHDEGYLYSMQFRYPYISRDNGKTWTRYKNGCVRLMDLWYGIKGVGYSLCFQGAFVVSNNLQKQSSLESPWVEAIPKIPVLTHKLFVSDKRDLMFYVGVNGLVYLSQDGGRSWKEERRTF